MPKLISFLARHAAIGFAIAIAVVTLMMIADFAALRTLMMASDVGLLSLFLLTFFLGLTLSSVQMGVALILLNDKPLGRDGRSIS